MALTVVTAVLSVLALLGTAYSLAAAALAQRYRRVGTGSSGTQPAITILKPLHGAEPALAANLRTTFAQEYSGPIQVVAGTRHAEDPANGVMASVAHDHPGVAFDPVASATRHGANNKLSNLINMVARARHPVIVLADSDVAWPADALARLATALADPGVGAASCLHAGRGDAGFWSTLAAMDISYRYMPSVILGTATGLAHPMLGPTMALRRETLDAIGGFAAFGDVLADDYEIGRAVRGLGLRTVVPPFFVTHSCPETTLRALVAHELRWSVTIYRIDPAGFAGSFVTHSLALALLAALTGGFSLASLGVIAASMMGRLVLKRRMDVISGIVSGPLWLMPLRDLISFGVFCATFFVHDVDWRGSKFRVSRDGRLENRASS